MLIIGSQKLNIYDSVMQKAQFLILQKLSNIDLVWFNGISTIVGYLMPNPFYTNKYMISKHILLITFLNEPGPIFLFFFILHTV